VATSAALRRDFTRTSGAISMTTRSKSRRQPKERKKARVPAEPARASTPGASSASVGHSGANPIAADSLDEAFVEALKADFSANAHSAIAALRSEKPADYVKIIASLCTKDVGDAADPLRDMSDVELACHVEELARRAGYDICRSASPQREGRAGDEGEEA
jgi:hypothetical protein